MFDIIFDFAMLDITALFAKVDIISGLCHSWHWGYHGKTSGTTGKPKGSMITHGNLKWVGSQIPQFSLVEPTN